MDGSPRYASGRGPGVITPDGCAVELYSLFPPGYDEAAVITSVARPGDTVLELGAGAGRVTHCLLAHGLSVVAVDESAEMLARITGATTVQGAIEALELERRFDVVVLGSHLINVPDDELARAFLRTCARHVNADGRVLVERMDVGWFDTATESHAERDGITYSLSEIVRQADDVTATVTYTAAGQSWSQTFTTRRRDDDQIAALFTGAGLEFGAFLDERRTWAVGTATPRASG